VFVSLLFPAHLALAVDVMWFGPDLGNWNVDANWSGGIVPSVAFDEAAVINNFTTAVLSAHAMSQGSTVFVGGLRLGTAAANVGGLRIENGGNLPLTAGTTETGAAQIGIAGQGNLTILGGGALTTTNDLTLDGAAGSSLTLGDASELVATLSIGGTATLNRTTNIIGQDVDFSVIGNLILGATSVLTGEIRHPSQHSALKSAGTATLGGTFRPAFNGVTPVLGDKWTIIDASAIAGSLALDLSAALPLPVGQVYQLRQATGGANGKLIQLSIEDTVLAGDYNQNGMVDAPDYAMWRDARGSTTNLAADGNGNGTVDTADYNFWRARFGQTAVSGAAAGMPSSAVPELKALALAWLAALAAAPYFDRL
jgi:hypothetical protein